MIANRIDLEWDEDGLTMFVEDFETGETYRYIVGRPHLFYAAVEKALAGWIFERDLAEASHLPLFDRADAYGLDDPKRWASFGEDA